MSDTLKQHVVNRSVLGEGRNFGMGFTILKKEKDGFLPLVEFTACKDYLNDIVHIEKYNTITGTVYGFNHKYCNYYENDDKHVYVAIKAVHYRGGSKWSDYDKLQKLVETNSKQILKVLHYFERKLDIDRTRTKYITLDSGEKVLVFKADRFWAQETFLISLYTLLIRYYINFNAERASLQSLYKHKGLINADEYLMKNDFKKLIISKARYLQEFKKSNYGFNYSTISSVHNHGIVAGTKQLFKDGKFKKV